MRFSEAEKQYHELEAQLSRGELTDDNFLDRVAEIRVVDGEGRRWKIAARSGRWLVHDGRQYVFAEPSREEAATSAEPAVVPAPQALPPAEAPTVLPLMPEVQAETQVEPIPQPQPQAEAQVAPIPQPLPQVDVPTVPMPIPVQTDIPVERVSPTEDRTDEPRPPMLSTFQMLLVGTLTVILIGCLIGGGVSAWVMVLRDLGETTPVPTVEDEVALVTTYTPRPATPTYTPTPTPTPSRTPTPTNTPPATDTPVATATFTAMPTTTRLPASSTPLSSVSATPSAVPTAQMYTVKAGETLSEIAAQFGLTVQELAEANDITNTALVQAGQVLVIPPQQATAVAQAGGPTATWTPIVLNTRAATGSPQATATSTPGATATSSPSATATPTPTQTPKPTATQSGPTATPQPTATPTPKAASLEGKIAFTVWNPYHVKYELYVSNIDGSGRNMLGEGFRQPQFRPDGNWLVVNGEGAPNLEHLVKMDANGGQKIEVSNHTEDAFPSWWPNGESVAYSSDSWGDGQTRIGIVHDLSGMIQDWVPLGNSTILGEYPFWMPNGKIVYQGCSFWSGGGNCGLYKVSEGGGTPERLSDHQSDTAPSGSGTRVAFMSSRDGNWEVYAINMNGTGLARLTENSAQDGLPTWSPDGKSIAFVSNRSGAWAIWVMNGDGSNQRKLFDLGGGYGSGDKDWTRERISWAP
jgi:LysM repeat protein